MKETTTIYPNHRTQTIHFSRKCGVGTWATGGHHGQKSASPEMVKAIKENRVKDWKPCGTCVH